MSVLLYCLHAALSGRVAKAVVCFVSVFAVASGVGSSPRDTKLFKVISCSHCGVVSLGVVVNIKLANLCRSLSDC
jgi:hypothetical protein